MARNAVFWDRIAEKYAAAPIRNMAAYEHTMARTRSYLHPADHVLEVGCGTGSTALLLAPEVAHITATDVSPGMIAIARNKAQDRKKQDSPACGKVTFTTASADETLPTRAGGYDIVTAFNLLHLVNDLDVSLRAIHARLRPGGRFISKTACLAHHWYFRPLIAAMRAVGKAPPVLCFRAEALEQAMRRAGFAILESQDHAPRPPARFIVAERPAG